MLNFLKPVSSTTNRTSLGRLVNQSTKLLMGSIGLLILLLAFLTLFHQNANATRGYQLRNLERERSQLLLDQEIVQMQVAQKQALTLLEKDIYIQSMVQVKRPKYTEVEKTVAVSNKL
ncbi:hypothetical protein HN512_01070 [Candidatus Peregrinibacteria bacterium]|nr:hypothetical protein [Candidatus Peregrinibacteria bacterium]MBT3598410.1 hypothetical protein [Candidatus Peregrinibacteria bacterium]MBT4367590.1 hypothetical protein [Candidatus Peregrinibacteria bacterium]MBT4586240.1 hypothetical protein [Candidatus Peregrinibacteria bacterium]MBT6731066.1 hypothetical protein [Candidatus Peregrinibacteria bacterium]